MDDEFWEHLLHKGTEFIETAEFGNAIETFEQVARSGHPEAAPKAAALLGLLLCEAGDADQAAALFEYAMASEHQVAAPKAALGLARLRYTQGDILGTQHAYAVAALSDEVGMATTAKVAIEQLHDEFEQHLRTMPIGRSEFERARRLRTIDDLDGARAAFQRSVASEDPDYAPRSAIELALYLLDSNETDDGRALLRLAVESTHTEHAPVAALLLADHLVVHDEQQPAREMLMLASTADNQETALEATAKLAELLVRTERYVSAIERFAVLVAEAETEIGAHAAFRIGVLLDEVDDRAAAACFCYASEYAPHDIAAAARESVEGLADRLGHPPPDTASRKEVQDRVSYAVGRLWLSEGAVDEACRAFETARESQAPGIAEDAENFLRSIATTAGTQPSADPQHAPLDDHPESDDPAARTDQTAMGEVDPAAVRAWALEASEEQLDQFCNSLMDSGHSCYDRAELLEAVYSWERVAATGHQRHAPAAVAQIAVVFYSAEGMRGAEGGIDLLTKLELGELTSRAWLVFARRLARAQHPEAAEGALRRAAAGDAEHAADCALRLLRDDRGNVHSALDTLRSHTPDLVPEVLEFALALAEAKKLEAADAYRVADVVATIAGYEGVAEVAREQHGSLTT